MSSDQNVFIMDVDTFSVSAGPRRINGRIFLPSRRRKSPFVIACHGLLSNMTGDKFQAIARRFPQHGIGVVLFDFGGCGESSGSLAESTATNRLQDLTSVVNHAKTHPCLLPDMGIMGSSFGGFVSILYASRYPAPPLSLWATPCNLRDIKGNLPSQDLDRLNEPAFFHDAGRYEMEKCLKSLSTVQVIQCAADEIVPASHPEKIYTAVCDPKEFLIIPGADHAITDKRLREQALVSCLNWFRSHLKTA